MSCQEPIEQTWLRGECVECPTPKPSAVLDGEQDLGHQLGWALDTPVRCLVTVETAMGQCLGQSICLPEGQSQPLTGERVHRTGSVTYQRETPMRDAGDSAQG